MPKEILGILFFSPAEAAERLQLHPQTILTKIRAKQLQAKRHGRTYLISEENLRAYYEKYVSAGASSNQGEI